MSTRNGDKARANRERKKKELRNKRTQELRKAPPSKTAVPAPPATPSDENQLVTSRLRRQPQDNQGEPNLEIVISRAPAGAANA